MRKFKHKTTGIIGELFDDGHLHFERCGDNMCCYETIWKGFIENSNDWEEITERDYKILSFRFKGGSERKLNKKDNLYYLENDNNIGFDLETMLKNCTEYSYYIKSIQRLSDNKIFTIGDRINILHQISNYDNLKIRGFSIDNMGNCIVSTKDEVDRTFYKRKGCNISIIEHSKQKLFTTEDGVDIYEDDTFWFLNKNLKYSPNKSKNYCNDSHLLYFSTKEAAEDYILMNKPLLSLKDISKATKARGALVDWVDISLLEKLVKERL